MTADTPIGIDLGTTFSVVAHLDRDGRPWTMNNAEGDVKTPSIVFFDQDSVIVGREALKAAEFEPERLARFIKREMGERLCKTRYAGQQYPPEVIQAFVLNKLHADAELKLGSVKSAVLTVPAFFNEPRRKATQDAGRLAGLEVLDLINEPTAAAVSYGVQQEFLTAEGESRQKETVLVYDLGGGTFDATLMQIDGHRYHTLSTSGDVYLGGIDWDERLAEHLAIEFYSQCEFNLRTDPIALQRLMRETEEAKHSLTARTEVIVHLSHEDKRCRVRVTRDKFEQLTSDLRERTLFTVQKVLREAKYGWSDVTRLLLVGGSSRMPAIKEMLERESNLEADRSLSPDEAVAHGAAIYAGLLQKHSAVTARGMSLKNVNSHDLGVVGVEVATGRKRRHVMIARNTSLPAEKSHKFETYKDNQPNVSVNIVEGGDAGGTNATPIARCLVDNLPAGLPAKTPVIVRFRYAENGRLSVISRLPSVDRKATVTIERAAGLSEDELELWRKRIIAGLVIDTGEEQSEPAVKEDEVLTFPAVENENPPPVTPKTPSPKEKTPPPSPAPEKLTEPVKVAEPKSKPVETKPAPAKQKQPQISPSETASVAQKKPKTKKPKSKAVVAAAALKSETISPQESVPTVPTIEPILTESVKVEPRQTTPPPIRTAVPPPLDSPQEVNLTAGEEDEETSRSGVQMTRRRQLAVFAVSTLLHLIVMLVLAFIMLPDQLSLEVFDVLSSRTEEEQKELEKLVIEKPQEVEKKEKATQTPKQLLADTKEKFEIKMDNFEPRAPKVEPTKSNRAVAVAPEGSEFSGRSSAGKAALLAYYGGTKESEGAVQLGLQWLERHQSKDGSWSFDHVDAACKGACKNPGNFKNSRMGATAMAILAMLGSGNTYLDGDFQVPVERGLIYLLKHGEKVDGDFRGKYDGNGGMYIQGLVTIALCEALAMSDAEMKSSKKRSRKKKKKYRLTLGERIRFNRTLKAASQQAIKFIINAQSNNGGWKYTPRSGGDTSVVGWQIMALASAWSAKLGIFPVVSRKASGYLDTVQSAQGAKYGYVSPQPKASTTAVGLLCRIYLGWRPGHPPLRYGVQYLSKLGPDKRNMYYNYYATQVLHQYGGEMWKKWNSVMRDQLVNSQLKKGHAAGSWNVTDPHAAAGGRLYQTCLSVMTLEVYYRHLPLYKQRTEEDGPAGKTTAKTTKRKSK